MTFQELLASMKALGVTVAVKDGRPVLKGANIPECMRGVVAHYRDDLLRHHKLAAHIKTPPPAQDVAHLAVQPDAQAAPTPFPKQTPRPDGTRVPCPRCRHHLDKSLRCYKCEIRLCLYCDRRTVGLMHQLCDACWASTHPTFPCDQARNERGDPR